MIQNRVMIVDDEELNRKLFKAIIEDCGGIVHCEAVNGVQAIELFDPENVDIVLMDMHMPDMKGTAVVKKMKEHMKKVDCNRKIAFIFIFFPKGCGEMVSMLGFYDVILPKPCNTRILKTIISAKLF
jgi:CheY-like chemotaxis protein